MQTSRETPPAMNSQHRKPLPGSQLDWFDARAAVDAIKPGAYATLPYTSRVFAENLVRRCDPALLPDALTQLIERRHDLDFPWFPAPEVCHDFLAQTRLAVLHQHLATLTQAIADAAEDEQVAAFERDRAGRFMQDGRAIVEAARRRSALFSGH